MEHPKRYTFEIHVHVDVDHLISSCSSDKIVVGSFHGVLRVYSPHPVKGENGWSGFKAEDVMCEMSLNQPILQIDAGRFMT